ncbi:MAG: hypothetical protein AAFW74_16190, partial [Pseudomonadota bacterium]
MTSGLDHLSSVQIPDDHRLVRDHVHKPSQRGDGYDEKYDFKTLIYDAFYLEARRSVVLICPKLLNFRALLAKARFRLGQQQCSVARIRSAIRYDEVWLQVDAVADELCIELAGIELRVKVNKANLNTFAGQNAVSTMSQNNELKWIRYWADYHARKHGCQAVLLYDNGSTLYEPAEVVDCLKSVAGLQTVKVIATPHKYGPNAIGKGWARAKFLQTALLNITRLRYLADAAAFLSCDIDELVSSTRQQSVFDEARKSRLGYVCFHGDWRFAATPDARSVEHRDHVFVDKARKRCPLKYCMVPSGPLRHFTWSQHRI